MSRSIRIIVTIVIWRVTRVIGVTCRVEVSGDYSNHSNMEGNQGDRGNL